MHFKLLSVLLILRLGLSAQTYYTPISLLFTDADELKASHLEEVIRNMSKPFNNKDIEDLKIKVDQNNGEVERQISRKKQENIRLSQYKQDLLNLKDLQKIREQIKEKERSRAAIKGETGKSLKTISFAGIYLVVQDCGWNDPKENLNERARGLLTPKAIEELNGVFISSLSQVKDGQIITDYVRQEVNGKLRVDNVLISRKIDNQTKHLYLAKVSVTPLEKREQINGEFDRSLDNSLIISYSENQDIKNQLLAKNLSSEEITKILSDLENTGSAVAASNLRIKKLEEEIINRGSKNYQEIDLEIKELRDQINNRNSKLAKLIKDNTDLNYNPNKSESSINAALSWMDSRLEQRKQEILDIKARELVCSKFNVNVSTEGTPSVDLAKTAESLLAQLQENYGKIEQFMSATVVENAVTSSFEENQQQDVYRKIDQVWLYPVPGDNDNFKLTVVCRFQITKVEIAESLASIESYNAKRKELLSLKEISPVDKSGSWNKSGLQNMVDKFGLSLIEELANEGNAIAHYHLGLSYYWGVGLKINYDESYKWFKLSAEQGNSYAQYFLGYSYLLGSGVAADTTIAIEWYRKSAFQNNPFGQNMLGLSFGGGWLDVKNYKEAFYWFELSANQDYTTGQYNLAHCYRYGQGTEGSRADAIHWYKKAASNGHLKAKKELYKMGVSGY